jgi:hypothetical protein
MTWCANETHAQHKYLFIPQIRVTKNLSFTTGRGPTGKRQLTRRCYAPKREAGITDQQFASSSRIRLRVGAARPHPSAVLRRDRHLEDTPDNDTVFEHVEVVFEPAYCRALAL